MSVTILEALENADINLDNVKVLGMGLLPMAQKQLHNARILLEKGYGVNDEVEPLLIEFGCVDDVPDFVS